MNTLKIGFLMTFLTLLVVGVGGLIAGRQGALMAPTETLAEQHFLTIEPICAQLGVPCALRTGSVRGEVPPTGVVVGTHALIQEGVELGNLAVAVVDEQHRFGVEQRRALAGGGSTEPPTGRACARPSKLHSSFTCSKSRPRAISTAQLNALLRLHRPPIEVVVSDRPYSLEGMGALISRWASRLDAFSGYPIQTWLISSAVGTTTDTPEVCSSRSSRTRDDSSQASSAHGG